MLPQRLICLVSSCLLATIGGLASVARATGTGRPRSLTQSLAVRSGTRRLGGGCRAFDITAYGARAGTGQLCTAAIQAAVDGCAAAGGGRVVVPPGTFLTGTIVLKDGVDLHLDKGAVLLGSPAIRDYPPQKPAARQRYERYLRTSLVFAQGARRVSVTGSGTLNGGSKGPNDFKADGRRARHRPCLVWLDDCTDVFVAHVTFTSSGFWTQVYTRCRNVQVDGIVVTDSTFDNNDGCDIVDCENFIVENCAIDCLDDGICMKGYTPAGCRNVVIRNNRIRSLCNGIKAGTDSTGGFQNILIENNEVYQTGIAGLALEIVDGGIMQNVVVRNIKMDVVGTPIFIKLGNRSRPVYIDGTERKPPVGTIRDVRISGIRATVDRARKRNAVEKSKHNYCPYACSITGFPGHAVARILIDDVQIHIKGGFPPRTEDDLRRSVPERSTKYPENRMFGVLPAYAFFIRHARGMEMRDVRVTIDQADARPAFLLDDVQDSVFRAIRAGDGAGTRVFRTRPNCTRIDLEE